MLSMLISVCYVPLLVCVLICFIYTYKYMKKYLSKGEGNGNPLWNSCLENPMDRGAWWATVHGVAKSWTQLSDLTLHLHLNKK